MNHCEVIPVSQQRPSGPLQLQIAKEVGYLEKEGFERLRGRAEKAGGRIGNLIKVLKRVQ
jgi:hypothetical protein